MKKIILEFSWYWYDWNF